MKKKFVNAVAAPPSRWGLFVVRGARKNRLNFVPLLPTPAGAPAQKQHNLRQFVGLETSDSTTVSDSFLFNEVVN